MAPAPVVLLQLLEFSVLLVEKNRCVSDCIVLTPFVSPTLRFLQWIGYAEDRFEFDGPGTAAFVAAAAATLSVTALFWGLVGRGAATIAVRTRLPYARWWALYVGSIVAMVLVKVPVLGAELRFGGLAGFATEVAVWTGVGWLVFKTSRLFVWQRTD